MPEAFDVRTVIAALRSAIENADGWHDDDRGGPSPDLAYERRVLAWAEANKDVLGCVPAHGPCLLRQR